MILAIHQPEFLPWLGYFEKMGRADQYVIFDHVQFKKRYFENRNKIKTGNKWNWITVPVKSKGNYHQAINDIEIENNSKWQKKMWKNIHHAYAKSPFYKEIAESLRPILVEQKYDKLIELNMACINWFREILKIENDVVYSSCLEVLNFSASDLILEICCQLKADTYLCGSSGKDYLNLVDFENAGVRIVWQDFQHPNYKQSPTDFIPNLSTLDLVMNNGPKSREIVFGASGNE